MNDARQRLQTAAYLISHLKKWRRRLFSMALGALAGLALPPLHAIPLLWLSFTGLIWLLDGAETKRRAFADGWWFGFGHFSVGVYWIAYAMLIDPVRFGWMIPFAVFGLGGVLAFFAGSAACLAWRLAPGGMARILMLAVGWGFFEWVRSWIFSGFPWNLLGSVWLPVLPVAQFAAIAGTYGLGVVTVVIACLPSLLGRPLAARPFVVWSATGLIVAGLAGWGSWRLGDGSTPDVPNVRLRLVQANIEQTLKWAPEMRLEHFERHLRLSAEPGSETITDVIWPETAAPSLLERDAEARRMIAQVTPPNGLLITGAVRATLPGELPFHLWNSMLAFDKTGTIVGTYDKSHLVPFGEYVPLHKYLPLEKLTPGGIDYASGSGAETIDLPGLPPVGPLICYEVIFPNAVVDRAHRPDWLLNLTNDGWYGLSAGPYQHLAAAQMRAIEEALPLVRAANTGISAVIDPYGRVLASLPLGTQGILDHALPAPLSATLPYARWGNWAFFAFLLLVGSCALLWARLFRWG